MVHRLLCATALFFTCSLLSSQVFYTEDFETDGEGSRYDTDNLAMGAVFNDGTSDHFGRTDGSDISGGYLGQNGTFFWAGEDLDDDGGDGEGSKMITFSSQTITGMNQVEFSGLFAQGENGGGLDGNEALYLEYNIDGAGWVKFIQFTGPTSGANVGWAEDEDLDGTGEGMALTTTFTSFTKTILVAGDEVQLRLFVSADSANEEFAFDFFRLDDVSVVSTCSIDDITDGGNQTVCDPTTNTYSNDVVISYSDAPATGMLVVNGQQFALAASPQTVTLAGLAADGADVDVMVSFSDEATCNGTVTGLFTAPADCLPANALLINEFDYDQAGTDSGEFLELYNSGATDIDLSLYEVVLVNGNDNMIYNTVALPAVLLAADSYFVVCFGSNSSAYCDLDASGASPQNGFDAVAILRSGEVVDALSYEGEVPGYVEGNAAGSDGEDNSLSRIPNGVDTDDNSSDFTSTCPTPGSANALCVGNNDCSEAAVIEPTEFGGTVGFAPYTTSGSTASAVCSGIGDEVVWFQFVAESPNDAIVAGVDASLTAGFPTGFDAVIEVFDACDGTSLGCFDNYGANELERAVVGGLVAGNTYYYSVHTSGGAGSTTSNDFHTTVRTYADQRLRDQYCGFDGYTLNDIIMSQRDDFNEIYDLPEVYVTGYAFRFELEDGTVVAEVTQPEVDGFYLTLGDVSVLEYNVAYYVSVAHSVRQSANGEINDYWSDYGELCAVKMDFVIPAPNLRDQFCDTGEEFQLSEYILCTQVSGANGYLFHFSDGENTISRFSYNYSLTLYSVPGLEYNTTYEVTVQARVGEVWSLEGTACTLIMASQPESPSIQSPFCGQTYEYPASEYILSDYILGATIYQYQFVSPGTGTTTFDRNTLSLILNSQIGLPAGDYDVSVRVFAGGSWGEFGPSCPITLGESEIPGIVDMKSKDIGVYNGAFSYDLYPNPNAGQDVMLQLHMVEENAMVRIDVLDMTGKSVMQEVISAKGNGSAYRLTFDGVLESGMYLVRLELNGSHSTKRLVVE